jgi:hypothetical protein
MRLNPVAVGEDGTITVDTDHFFGRDSYDTSQAVPARPGASFNAEGLRELPAAHGVKLGKERKHG